MNMDEHTVLQEMYQTCLQNREEENKLLQNNLNRIAEIDAFIKSIREETEADFKVFSPRNPENIYGDKIREKENEKNDFEKENQNHYKKINQLDKQIQQLELLINKEEKDNNKHLKIIDIQEKERQRIANELHDSSVQNLTHLIHMIELSSLFIDQDPIRAKLELETCIKNLKSVINEIRETIFNLRPMSFDDLGFRQCIADLISGLKKDYKNYDIEFNVCELDQSNWKIDDKCAIDLFLVTVYRIIQEGITNALKYSNADKIILTVLNKKDFCSINIKDNGVGFLVDKIIEQRDKHFGLSIMQERVSLINGKIDVLSEPGKGTELKIEIPLI